VIDEVDRELAQWISGVVDGVDVHLSPPSDGVGERPSVYLHLMELTPAAPTQQVPRPQPEMALRYLVTTAAGQAAIAHRVLGTLAEAAARRRDLTVEFKPPAPELWQAFGVSPRPAFSILHRWLLGEAKTLVRVRTPAEIRIEHGRSLCGVVVTPGGLPVANARVELPGHASAVRTDRVGRFRFGAVPGGLRGRSLRILAHGLEKLLPVEEDAGGEVVIRFDPEEE